MRTLLATHRTHQRWAVSISATVHVLLFAGLLAASFPGFHGNWQRPAVMPAYAVPPIPLAVAEEAIATPAVEANPFEVTPEVVENRVQRVVQQSQTRSADENRDQFEKAAERLEKLSSAQGVDEIAAKLQGLLGTSDRATRPAEQPVAGEFDFETAQLYDVRREEQPSGEFRYFSVLLDAAGRTTEVEMDAVDGESAYKTLQRIKAFPLAEKVYRQITMPLLDKLLKAGKAAESTPGTK